MMPPEELEAEIQNLRKLDHPHIIKLFEYYEDDTYIYLVMECARGGDLQKVVSENCKSGQHIREEWSATVMQQVVEAIAYCHRRRLMHKDLKSENIMLLNPTDARAYPHAVVIDLGLAEMFSATGGPAAADTANPMGTMVITRRQQSQDEVESDIYFKVKSDKIGGTPCTMAPEVWHAYKFGGAFGMKCDVYSIGVVLFELLSGVMPFHVRTLDAEAWMAAIKKGPPLALLEHASTAARDLVVKMMAYDQTARPRAREVVHHAWFQEKATRMDSSLSETQLQALRDFSDKSELQKAILLQVASQLRAADVPRINSVFRKFDKDTTGYLDMDEMKEALLSMGFDKRSVEVVASAIDLDKNQKVEYTEFVAACIPLTDPRCEAVLHSIFGRLDTSNSGTLSHDSIKQLLQTSELKGMGFSPSGVEIEGIIREMDANGTGRISFKDFAAYAMRSRQRSSR